MKKKQTKITQFFPRKKILLKKRNDYKKIMVLLKNLNINLTF